MAEKAEGASDGFPQLDQESLLVDGEGHRNSGELQEQLSPDEFGNERTSTAHHHEIGDHDDDEPALPPPSSVTEASPDGLEGRLDQEKEEAMSSDHGDDAVLDVGATGDNDTPSNEKEHDGNSLSRPTELQIYYAWFMSDMLLYLVVLNVAAEVSKEVVVDSFGFSIFTALVLKIFLDIVVVIEHYFHERFFAKGAKVLGAFLMWFTVFSSKFVILWIDDVIFGSHVELGGFLVILILSVVLMVVGRLSRWVYHRLSNPRFLKCVGHQLLILAKAERYMHEGMWPLHHASQAEQAAAAMQDKRVAKDEQAAPSPPTGR